jgi:hypothetical protein
MTASRKAARPSPGGGFDSPRVCFSAGGLTFVRCILGKSEASMFRFGSGSAHLEKPTVLESRLRRPPAAEADLQPGRDCRYTVCRTELTG